MVLTPLLLQGWIPEIATFLNTPAWTMSAESFYYLLFPVAGALEAAGAHAAASSASSAAIWMLGLIPGTLYIIFNPDGIPHPDRFSTGTWLQALKFTPLPHLASFVFGVLLAELDELIPRPGTLRLLLGVFGFGATFFLLWLGADIPYAHHSRRPADAAVRLHHSRAGRRQSAVARARHPAAGLCWRSQLLPLPAALQLLEPDPRLRTCSTVWAWRNSIPGSAT